MTDLESRLRATFARVGADTEVNSFPGLDCDIDDRLQVTGSEPSYPVLAERPSSVAHPLHPVAARTARRSRRVRRFVVAAVAAVVVIGGGLSVGAATGFLPRSWLGYLGWDPTPGAFNADPSTARVLFETTTTDGTRLELWYADAGHHGFCLSLVERQPGVPNPASPPALWSTSSPHQPPVRGIAGGCSGTVGDEWWQRFGADRWSSSFDYVTGRNGGPARARGSAAFIIHVPSATRVRLVFPDHSARPLPVADQWTAVLLAPRQARQRPVLIGYDNAGHIVGTFRLSPP
jgi:hypothetical protein